LAFSDFLYRGGLPAGTHQNKDKNQTDELMAKAAEQVKTAKAEARKLDPDTELVDELYEFVKQAAAELGLDAPTLL
jgi:ribosome-binding protein aMBF1 (putative translation factor)